MKAYIDRKNSELITVGFNPELARKYMLALGLENWGWIDELDDNTLCHRFPESWEIVKLEDEEK
jgi:hypothetical protein